MTPEQIIEMAKQAHIAWADADHCAEYRVGAPELQAFTQLVRNAALEEIAKHCEKTAGVWLTCTQAAVTAKEIRSLKS